jgi:UDP-N-acetylmuramate dehydrogenase
MTELQTRIHERFPELPLQFDVELAPLTYFKIGGPAEVLVDPKIREDLIKIVQFCRTEQVKLTVLGGASNVIVSTEGLRGVVIRTSNEEYAVLPEIVGEKQLVRAGAGFKTALFVRKTIDDGFGGLEYFLGVPGKLSGAIFNNAHYLSDLVGEHIHRVEVVTSTGEVKWLSHEECKFGYDSSVFHGSGDIIIQAEFLLGKGDKTQSMELVKEATIYRAKTQPLGEPSSGCYFQNASNTESLKERFPQFAERRECPSAFLIDQAGLKGTKVGGIKISEKHAAFFINTGSGTSQEVEELARIVKQRVQELYGVELKEEVFLLK